ncbi:MAG TPA: glycosyltransferase family 4 protein [Gemmatimonadales bacterium]|nr:glycosyltransferase family 4 protein [Gemmatimonadales bacterium]
MRALVIAPEPFFTARGTPFSVYYRTLLMAESGVSIDLLTYGQGQDVDLPGVRLIRIPALRWLGAVRVGPSALKAVHDVLIAVWTVALLLRKRYDVVHAHEESVFIARLLKPVFRFQLIYDMHSSLPQQLENFQYTSSRLLIWLFERLELASLTGADAVITICPELARFAIERMPDPRRHFLIENSLLDEVRLKPNSHTAPETGEVEPPVPADRPLILYAGSFEPYQGLHLLIAAFARVRERRPDAFLVVMGGLPDQVRRVRAQALAHGLDGHCVVAGRVPQHVARQFTQRATSLVSPRDRGTNTPLKIYEQLASGIPLVATRILSHTQILNDQVSILVEPTVEGLADGIFESLHDTERRQRVIAGALALYDEKYSRPVYARGVRAVLDLIQRGCAAQRSRLVVSYHARDAVAASVTREESAASPSR